MAAAINERVVEEIKQRIDLADLIASYGIEVRTAGATKKACCPFHHEKTPSFNINESKGFYHCFGCGESGDAIKFVMKMDGLQFIDAVKKLAAQTGVKLEEKADDPKAQQVRRLYALLAELAQFYRRCLLQTKEAQLGREYLVSRELGEQVGEDYLIGYAPNGVANILKWAEKHGYTAQDLEAAGVIKSSERPGDCGYHRFGGRLMFTIRDRRGRVVGFSGRQLVASKNSGKYVNSPETPVFSKKRILYGFDKAAAAITRAAHREVIVCEGQIDCIRLQTCGFPNAVAGQGTAFTEFHVEMLAKVADQATLVYDDDGAGHEATIKSARLCLAHDLPVRVVSLPGGDDPDSFLRSHPAEEFRALLESAESIMAFQVRIEKAKEGDRMTVDAMNRIVRKLLITIAVCHNAVMRAAMTSEAAKLLQLPETALAEELAKVKTEVKTRPLEGLDPPVDDADEAVASAEAAEATAEPPPQVIFPPLREFAILELLIANEIDDEAKTLAAMVAEFLPDFVFVHPFTIEFIRVWRAQLVEERDLLAPWRQSLAPNDAEIFDRALLAQHIPQKTALTPIESLQDLIVKLWIDYLMRQNGNLPAKGDLELDRKKMRFSANIALLRNASWPVVKEFIRNYRIEP